MIEPTVTQNSALYFAQHKIYQPRVSLIRRFVFKVGKRRRKDAPSPWPTGEVFLRPQIHYGTNR
jgi:hypothetical protein